MYANTIYSINHILATFYENALAAYIIKKIVCLNKNDIYFVCKKLDIICYETHFACYRINKCVINEYTIQNINYFHGPPINLYNIPMYTNEYVIRLKHYF